MTNFDDLEILFNNNKNVNENNFLRINNGDKINKIDDDYKIYFRRMTLIFGESNTGKTTIVKHILFLLKNYIPITFIVAPTNSSNNAFTNLVPSKLIKLI